MPVETQHNGIDAALRAAFIVMGDEGLQQQLQDERQANSALQELGLPPSARGALLDIVNKLSWQRSAQGETDAKPVSTGAAPTEVKRLLLESFVQIRWSFWVSITMSVILFVVGLVFLATALVQSLTAGSVSTSTLTVAGLGLADFVLLFYTRPWKDIAANLANSQQIRMIATSYLAGFALIGKPEQRKELAELTEQSVQLVQKFVEVPVSPTPGEPPRAG